MDREVIDQAKAYIHEHIGEKLTNTMIARHISYHRQSLTNNFKKYEGISVRQYVIKAKAHKAREYLEKGYYPSEIVAMLGYKDRDKFYSIYKKEFGESPKKAQLRIHEQHMKGIV